MPGLVNNSNSYVIDKVERKVSGKGAVRAGKAFTVFVSNEDMNDIFKIIKPLEDSSVLIDGVTETVNHKINIKKVHFLELC